MAGRIDEIKDIFLAVRSFVDQSDSLALDRNAAFPLQIHVVQDLVLHFTACEKARPLDHAIRKRRFAVIDMGHNAEIAGPLANAVVVIVCHRFTLSFLYGPNYAALIYAALSFWPFSRLPPYGP
jgi:hypothetical protein